MCLRTAGHNRRGRCAYDCWPFNHPNRQKSIKIAHFSSSWECKFLSKMQYGILTDSHTYFYVTCEPTVCVMLTNRQGYVNQQAGLCDPTGRVMWPNRQGYVTQQAGLCDSTGRDMWPNRQGYMTQQAGCRLLGRQHLLVVLLCLLVVWY